jgi:hypothetical protein
MEHRCSHCGASAIASLHEPLHLPCDCDDGEIETLHWCDACNEHVKAADGATVNHWMCPACAAVWRFV